MEKLFNRIQKSFGDDVRIGLRAYEDLVYTSTGSFELDVALGTGGWPSTRISVLIGPPSCGKSTITLNSIANAQKSGMTTAYIDTESSFDPLRAKNIGIDLDSLLLFRVKTLEAGGELIHDLAYEGIKFIVFDSVAGASIKPLEEGEIGETHMGKRARIMSNMMMKITGVISFNGVTCLFVNQKRDNLNTYGTALDMPGGHALPHASTMIARLSASSEKEAELGGIKVNANIIRNKLAIPFRKTEFSINNDGTLDRYQGIANVLTDSTYTERLGVEGSGWYTLPGELFGENNKVHGTKPIVKAFEENPELADKVQEYILTKLTRKYWKL